MNLSRNLVIFLLFISGISCRHSNTSVNKIALINEVVRECILQDSLFVTDTILNRFAYYESYELKYSDEGLEVPSKDWHYVNIDKLIDEIGNQELFNQKRDRSFLESQLINSKEFSTKYKLSKYIEVSEEVNPSHFYIFYQPIFNKEYTAVYLRYNYINGTYMQSDAVILKKNKDKWTLVKRYGIWIN